MDHTPPGRASSDGAHSDGAHSERVLRIDCDECAMVGTSTCDDCLVTFLCHDGGSAVVIDVAEVRALRLLRNAGLAPGLRHQRRDERSVQARMVRSQ